MIDRPTTTPTTWVRDLLDLAEELFGDQVPAFAGWTLPDGWTPDNVGRCRSCQAEILWCVTPKGKKAPVNADGTSHFATCPQSDSWRRRA